MENELSNNMPKALDTNKLENISGGKIVHSKDKEEKDIYYVMPDYTMEATYGPMGQPKLCMKETHGKFSGPYSTEAEAIEEAKKCGCTNTDVVDVSLRRVMVLEKLMKHVPNQ